MSWGCTCLCPRATTGTGAFCNIHPNMANACLQRSSLEQSCSIHAGVFECICMQHGPQRRSADCLHSTSACRCPHLIHALSSAEEPTALVDRTFLSLRPVPCLTLCARIQLPRTSSWQEHSCADPAASCCMLSVWHARHVLTSVGVPILIDSAMIIVGPFVLLGRLGQGTAP